MGISNLARFRLQSIPVVCQDAVDSLARLLLGLVHRDYWGWFGLLVAKWWYRTQDPRTTNAAMLFCSDAQMVNGRGRRKMWQYRTLKIITLEVKVSTGGIWRPSLYRDTGLGPLCTWGKRS